MPTGSQPPRHPNTETEAGRGLPLQLTHRRSSSLPAHSPLQRGTPVAHREEECQKAAMLPRRHQDHHLHHGSPRHS